MTGDVDSKQPAPDASFDELLSMLANGDAQTRGLIAMALGKVPDERVVEPLAQLLADEDARVRSQAALSLGQTKLEAALEPLILAAHDVDDPALRANALAALSKMPGPRVFNTAVAALFDADPDVRKNAAVVAGRLHDARAVEPLVMLLEDDSAAVRANAAWSLGALADAAAADPLVRLLTVETDAQARSNALTALGGLATDAAVECVLAALFDDCGSPSDRIAATIAVVDIATREGAGEAGEDAARRALPMLVELAQVAVDDELAATAVWALGHLPLPEESRAEVVDVLCSALAHPYRWVVAYAIESLAVLRASQAREALERVARDRDDDLAQLAGKAVRIIDGEADIADMAPQKPGGAA